MNTEEINKRFDERFKYVFAEKDPIYGEENRRNKQAILAFIQSEIDKAVQETKERAIACAQVERATDEFENPYDSCLEIKGYNSCRSQVLSNLNNI